MVLAPLSVLHLFSGYGGFELALKLVGLECRSVGHVEREAFCASLLVARMEDEVLDRAPVWAEVESFDARPFRGRVDLVTAGFPCPDFSVAGHQRGVHGDRWLWPDTARLLRDVDARYLFVENVPGLVRLGGLPRILADLAGGGFDARWGGLGASDVGAPHLRKRFWLLAWRGDDALAELVERVADADRHGSQRQSQRLGQVRRWPRHRGAAVEHPAGEHEREPRDVGATVPGQRSRRLARQPGSQMGDADSPSGLQVPRGSTGDEAADGQRTHPDHHLALTSTGLADAQSLRRRAIERLRSRPRRGRTEPAASGGELPDAQAPRLEGGRLPGLTYYARPVGFPPGPGDDWGHWVRSGGPEPLLRRGADGPPAWLADALAAGGNGIVPQVAAMALRGLVADAWAQTPSVRRADAVLGSGA